MNDIDRELAEFMQEVDRISEIISGCMISIFMFLVLVLVFWLCRGSV